ncbi:MAG: hypothetical protein RSA90_00200 [Lachnospiraceae bacterium]
MNKIIKSNKRSRVSEFFGETHTKFWNIMYVLSLCLLFMLLHILLMDQEVRADSWFIESSADGLFGEENRNLMVLGGHFFLSGLISILSMTGIRIFWFNIILILACFGSNFILCSLIIRLGKGRFKYLWCLLALILIMPMLWELDFTVVSAYTLATGCALLFFAVSTHGKKILYFTGMLWSILGYMIRIDCIYFSVAFFGIVGILQISKIWYENRNSHKKTIEKSIGYIFPLLCVLVLIGLLHVTQIVVMNVNQPDFLKWNKVRTTIDDYEMPDYEKYEEIYQDIGLSYNDYCLLLTWEYQDPEFFTMDRMKKLQQLKKEVDYVEIKHRGLPSYFKQSFIKLSSNNIYWIIILLTIGGIIFLDYATIFTSVVIVMFIHILGGYFEVLGRLIPRIQYAILLTSFIAIIYLYIIDQRHFVFKEEKNKIRSYGFICLLTLLFLTYKASEVQQSTYSEYKTRITEKNCLLHNILMNEKKYSETYDTEVSRCLAANPETLYFQMFSRKWLQMYPLNVKNVFLTSPIGTSSNQAYLGQYQAYLSTNKKILEVYDIANPFRSLIDNHVRAEIRGEDIGVSGLRLKNYLQEHYYPSVDFSIEYIYNECLIIRFMEDVSLQENCGDEGGEISLNVWGMSQVYDGLYELGIQLKGEEFAKIEEKNLYIKLEDISDESHTYCVLQDGENDGKFSVLVNSDNVKTASDYTITVYEQRGDGVIPITKDFTFTS